VRSNCDRGCVFKRRLPSGREVWGFSVDVCRDSQGKPTRILKTGFRRQTDEEAS
jgi:hypothetical protein